MTDSASASAGGSSGAIEPLGGETTVSTAQSGGATESAGTSDGGATDSDSATGSISPTSSAGEATGNSQGETTTAAEVTATTGASGDSDSAPATSGEPVDPSAGSTGGGVQACVPTKCDGKLYACGDCKDNDGDGKVDQADPECVGPCDDREDIFATDLAGDNADPCKQDCFFDGNSGAGGADCQWNLKCDKAGPGKEQCPYDEAWADDPMKCPDSQGEECLLACQAPNGCDCFGCCTVEVDGKTKDIFLGDKQCSLDKIDSCASCTKNEDCVNNCDPNKCEVCFPNGGELPPGCLEPTCPPGFDSCKVDTDGGSTCPDGFVCTTGCCFPS